MYADPHVDLRTGSACRPGKSMKKILLIEDEANLREAISGVLKKRGFEVVEASDGEAGIELAKSENPDLALVGWSQRPFAGGPARD